MIMFVTHHIEEIGSWIQHVIMLKDGSVLAHGTPDDMITSERMQELFDCSCTVLRQGNEFQLRVEAS
jgi:iron complex transport system ATP-binding protein